MNKLLGYQREIAMDWKTFVVEITKSLAWPIVTVFLIYQLKDRLAELLPRLRKLKHKDTELEFAEKLNELALESQSSKEGELKLNKTPEVVEKYNFLIKLAEVSPRSAVIESYRYLETASAKAVMNAKPDLQGIISLNPNVLQKLLSKDVLSSSQMNQLNQLRKLRNQAAHMEDFELRDMPIEAYIDIALSLSNYLENYNPNKQRQSDA